MKKQAPTNITVTPHSVVCWINAKQIPASRCADEYVLVWLDAESPVVPCSLAVGYQDGDEWFYAGSTEKIRARVTHWAPLPAGPTPTTASQEYETTQRVRLEQDRRGLTEQLTKALDELRWRNEELRVVWHAMACAFDHCERCIEDADVIKRIRFRLGPAT